MLVLFAACCSVALFPLAESSKYAVKMAENWPIYGSTLGVEGTVWPAMGNGSTRTEAPREPSLSASETTQLLNDGITTTCQLTTTRQKSD